MCYKLELWRTFQLKGFWGKQKIIGLPKLIRHFINYLIENIFNSAVDIELATFDYLLKILALGKIDRSLLLTNIYFNGSHFEEKVKYIV